MNHSYVPRIPSLSDVGAFHPSPASFDTSRSLELARRAVGLARVVADVALEADDVAVSAASPRYFRPTDVDLLIGDPTKAREKLGWKHEVGFEKLIEEMVTSDLERAKNCDHRNDGA